MRTVIIGGGAAGFFCALNLADLKKDEEIIILEKSSKLLSKVKISGGGRCNVTHGLFDIKSLVKKYPRGEKELLGPFHQFSPASVIEWFRTRGVKLKTEADGRMFPETDSSETIIDCFMTEAEKLGVQIQMNCIVQDIVVSDNKFELVTSNGILICDHVVIATGGNTDELFKKTLTKFGHSFTTAVPSLFTFNVPNHPINSLMGVSVPNALVKLNESKLKEEGPLLITHWGFSGPAVLRLSAWGARHLAACNYRFKFTINWLNGNTTEEIYASLSNYKQGNQKKSILNFQLDLPKRLWRYMVMACEIDENALWQNVSKQQLQKLSRHITNDEYEAQGKTTYKEEFVTCGGVNLKEIDFKTMESKMIPGLYFAGEIIDVDGITGGFNFQNAWTTGWIAANSIANH
jgi:predicted Rossmann fold flavoprotein